jgi:iron complex outermembrane receptor protein
MQLLHCGSDNNFNYDTTHHFIMPITTSTQGSFPFRQRLLVRSLQYGMLGLSLSGSAYAQQASADQNQSLPEVTVNSKKEQEKATGPVQGYVAKRSATGTKTDTPITETPMSLSVVTSDQIAAQQARTVSEALGFTSGVQAPTGAFAVTESALLLRGFPINNGGSIYRDGTLTSSNANYSRYAPEPYGLERIELLHGPASVLFGQNQPGGVINVVSKKPTTTPLHELQVQVGSYNRKQVAGDFSGPIDDAGIWSYRITGLVRDAKTQVDDTVDKRTFLSPAITWRPSNRTELTIRAEYQRTEGLSNNLLPAAGTVAYNPNGQIPTNRVLGLSRYNNEVYENSAIGYQFEHRFDDVWSVRQNVRYSSYNGTRNNLRFGSFFPTTQLNTVALQRWQLHTDADTITADNQVQADFTTSILTHKVIAGVDYHRTAANLRGYTGNITTSTLSLFNPVYVNNLPAVADNYNVRTVDDQFGAYLQDQIKIAQRWLLSAGVRRDWSDQTTQNYLSKAKTERNDKAFTRNFGLVYQMDHGISPYSSYSQSFTPVSGTTSQGVPLKPEQAKQYEVGVKYEPVGTNALFTAALFDLRRQNVTTTDLSNPTFSVQTGEARSRGLELEAKASLVRGLNTTASYSYTNTEVTSANDAKLGKALPGAAKHSGGVWADYAFQNGALVGLHVAGGVRYIGRSYGNALNTFETPSVTLIDFGARYDLGQLSSAWRNFELGLKINNVADRVYAFCYENCEYGARRAGIISLTTRW